MQTNNQNLDNFIRNFRNNFEEMQNGIKQRQWGFNYDDTSDILYFSPKNQVVSKDSILIPAGDSCISARVGADGKIQSIVIESFDSIFVQENPEFQNLYEKLTSKDKIKIEADTIRKACSMLLGEFNSALNIKSVAHAHAA